MRKAMKIFIGAQVVGGLGLAAYLKYQEVKNEDEEKNKMKAEIKRLMKEMVNLRKTYIIILDFEVIHMLKLKYTLLKELIKEDNNRRIFCSLFYVKENFYVFT